MGKKQEYCCRGHKMEETRRRTKSGIAYCSACHNIIAKNSRIKRKESGYVIKWKYGITKEDYERVFSQQNGCAICHKTERGVNRFHIDHDHETGKFRGILCHNCNIGLGLFFDSIDLLQKAALYLAERKGLINAIEGRNIQQDSKWEHS